MWGKQILIAAKFRTTVLAPLKALPLKHVTKLGSNLDQRSLLLLKWKGEEVWGSENEVFELLTTQASNLYHSGDGKLRMVAI